MQPTNDDNSPVVSYWCTWLGHTVDLDANLHFYCDLQLVAKSLISSSDLKEGVLVCYITKSDSLLYCVAPSLTRFFDYWKSYNVLAHKLLFLLCLCVPVATRWPHGGHTAVVLTTPPIPRIPLITSSNGMPHASARVSLVSAWLIFAATLSQCDLHPLTTTRSKYSVWLHSNHLVSSCPSKGPGFNCTVATLW